MARLAEEKKPLTESRTFEASRRIAQEARHRITQVASRIPRASAFLKFKTDFGPAERIVVVSDTHLGFPVEEIMERRMVEVLCDELSGMGQIDELILLGDVFDFWQATVEEALERGRDMMTALFTMDNIRRMIYIPGNHDHHAFQLYHDEEKSHRLRKGSIDPPELSVPMTNDCPIMEALRPSGARVPLYMAYPLHQVIVQGKQVLLTHGQMLGFFERSIWSPKNSMVRALFLGKEKSLSLEDMERFVAPYYEMLTLSAAVPGVLEGRYRVYRWISASARILGVTGESRESLYRDTTIEENAAEVEALLDHFCEETPDYFVFGHTHLPGRMTLPVSGVEAINTGCWLPGAAAVEAPSTMLEISDEARFIQVDIK